MSWCRANIGIGAPREPHPSKEGDQTSLPFSLARPILNVPMNIIKEATGGQPIPNTKAKDGQPAFPGVTTALSSYMLKLLDSPAYYNLTPAYLADIFNPSTPDRDDIKYFSIAARAPKLSVWHPLWLPKFVLDAADNKRVEEGVQSTPSKGNDGLVPIESAMHGEFLGVVENCDHWELRGTLSLAHLNL